MTQVNNNGFNNINGVSNNTPNGQQSVQVQKIIAQGSGQLGGISSNVGQALIGFNHDNALEGALANADASPTRAGVENLILAVFHGDAGRAARGLLPPGASLNDIRTLAGALTTPDYGQAA